MDELMKIESDVWKNVSKEFDRTEATLQEDVEIIKEWLKAQPHLPEVLGDVAIRNFLILNKCSIEKTKKKIDMYYTVRSMLPEIYLKSNPKVPEFQSMMKAVDWILLPKMTPEMYRVAFIRSRDSKLFETLDAYTQLAYIFSTYEIRLTEDCIFGDVVINDMKGISVAAFAKWTPSFLSKSLFIYEKVYSMRLKALYLVNAPSFVGTFLTILKTIMKPKIFERIHVCTDTKILNEKLPEDILPKDYGGKEKSVDELKALWAKKFNQYQERFDELDAMKVNEELRPEKLKNDELLGFHGNFKKLAVD